MGWSEAARSVWGKTDRDTGSWMPLVQHLEDSAAVAGFLWDEWLAPNVRRVISEPLPSGEADGRALLTFLAGIHDLGKASPAFAAKAEYAGPEFAGLVTDMEGQGLRVGPASPQAPPHCRVGQFLLTEWLQQQGFSKGAADGFASPVGAHHGVPPTTLELRALRGQESVGATDAWRAVQSEIVEGVAARTGADQLLPDWTRLSLPLTAQVLLTAAVVVADWLASDVKRFPHEVLAAGARLANAQLARDLMMPWSPTAAPDAESLLRERFPHLADAQIHPMQIDAVKAAKAVEEPAALLIEAPMGQGKTEAALAAAEVLASRFGQSGVMVGLPTMATSDAMFGRVRSWIDDLPGDAANSIFLAHGKAELNDDYALLTKDAYYRSVGDPERDRSDPGGAQASSWLQGRRKGVLANMVVGTIDQVLMGALKVRHTALRLLALAGKVVVIDEVHASDVYMNVYLRGVLEWLGAFGTPVVLVSATLPPRTREELLAAYAAGRRGLVDDLTDQDAQDEEHAGAYPRVTVQGRSRTTVPVEVVGESRDLAVERMDDDVTELVGLVGGAVADGACVAVICNTVTRAQEAYDALLERLGPERVQLVHSRFVATDRMRREQHLRDLLGPPGSDGVSVGRPRGFVVVGTQVLEQSLDIDVDLMITDLAPIDLVLQRSGRLHRHRRGAGEQHRPEAFRTPRLYVRAVGPIDLAGDPPALDDGGTAVYGGAPLLRSALVLEPYLAGQPLALPADIPVLVARGYSAALEPPAGWATAWAEAEKTAQREAENREEAAGKFLLVDPFYERSMIGWLNARVDDRGDEARSAAQVRDGDEGIEVVIVIRNDFGEVSLLPGENGEPGRSLPDVSFDAPEHALAREVARHSLRLPATMSRGRRGDAVIAELERLGADFTGWQQSRWLRGVLVLPLDGEGRANISGQFLHYDRDRGLMMTAMGTEGA
ncbi:CRISPR-associated endonuclease/helicase Cas3 [Barrientosiimonas humi]|uniref:CRISPR-associated endonuclease/helicase Cas3 n=1 Tax=Barrientosiimonas humi TaxID=999931 RepID=A0A542XFV8_9MICO|nr:CRISPR-associated helicase Cas3' [Barrientosiimonas humi]TQL34700.1 CRISPR-associated endonuclease/helicase Cas3 [Barrientosiimonas humi]CAG7574690.1 CRISPR-associated nuclease/helicase Cas3 [Barrientosiimonas humi]